MKSLVRQRRLARGSPLRSMAVSFLVLFIFSLSALGVAASTSETVYIYNLHEPVPWKGKAFTMGGGTYWAGEIHIQYGGVPPDGTHLRAYCMQYDTILKAGRDYQYDVVDVVDSSTWRSIAYILSWYDPPGSDQIAAEIQGAIWMILTGTDPSGYGAALASEAAGKDVIRATDSLVWLPYDSHVAPGEKVTLTAKITSGRSNVLIKFETDGGVLDKDEDFTNGLGEASVTLTVPAEPGKVIRVEAYTKGVWPKKFLHTDETQNLIGLGDAVGLTTTTEIIVVAEFFVIPEVPLGTLTAAITCFSAFLVKKRKLLLSA